ncbi:MAG: hypothetical protein QOE80_3152 [Actinomycetota bacterium]|jgi:hypothetical protein|nr:hypothetical protein [Actinomycetota bacterium]
MWGTTIAWAGSSMAFYVAIRREIRRSYELLEKDILHVGQDLGHLDTRLGREVGTLDARLGRDFGHLDEGLREVRADIRRLDQKIDSVRGS